MSGSLIPNGKQQYLDANGAPLAGGKVYYYIPYTTTAKNTWQDINLTILNTNPIILDSAGECIAWGSGAYRQQIYDVNDNLIWDQYTYGINPAGSNFVSQEEVQTATQGQVVFTLATITYTPGINSLVVFVNGSKQLNGTNYTETAGNTVTFVTGLNAGDVVDFYASLPASAQNMSNAVTVAYNPPFINSVSTNVQAKLSQTVSVKDFGAVGDGTTDDTAAIQAAVNASKNVYFPKQSGSFYKCTSPITLTTGNNLYGVSGSIVKFFGCNGFTAASTLSSQIFNITISNLGIESDGTGTAKQGVTLDGSLGNFGYGKLSNLYITGFSGTGVVLVGAFLTELSNIESALNSQYGFYIEGPSTSINAFNCWAKSNTLDGFRVIGTLTYSTFTCCAAEDNGGDGYFFSNNSTNIPQAITLNSCGSEINTGHQFRFQQVLGLTVNSCWVNDPSAVGKNFLFLDGCRNVTLNGIYMAQTAPAGYYAFYLGNVSGAQFPSETVLNGCQFSSISGFTEFIAYYRDAYKVPLFSSGSGTYSNTDVVTHNLGITPSNVFVSTGSATVHAAAYNFTSTTFTVTIYNNAGTPITNQAITWQASY